MNGELSFECTSDSLSPQDECQARQVTLDDWLRFSKRWRIYSDWGPQEGDIETLQRKGFSLFVLFENERAIACAGRLPRTDRKDEVDSVWVAPSHRGKGLGRRIVGFVTELILKDGKVALYRTQSTNLASARVAEEVGYRKTGSPGGISRLDSLPS